MSRLPHPEWAIYWIVVHSCSIWILGMFLAGLAGTGFALNSIISILIMGFGITTIARMVRLATRKIPFRINKEYAIWSCISAFSFWASQLVVAGLFRIPGGMLSYVCMGFGVWILSLLFAKILASKKSFLSHKKFHMSPGSSSTQKKIHYGKNIGIEKQIFRYVNAERKKHHLHALAWSDSLYPAGQRRALEITKEFSHDNIPAGCGENIAQIPLGRVRYLGFITRWNISRAFIKTWMSSPGHWENILRPGYSSMCVGIVVHGRNYYAIQLFA
jgi:hypothetical protein